MAGDTSIHTRRNGPRIYFYSYRYHYLQYRLSRYSPRTVSPRGELSRLYQEARGATVLAPLDYDRLGSSDPFARLSGARCLRRKIMKIRTYRVLDPGFTMHA